MRRKIVGGLLAATGVIAVALTNYFVEHGELPIWLSKIVAWCIEFGAFAVPIPFWVVFTVLMICVVSLIGITYMYERQTRQNFAYTDELKTAYRELRSKYGSLEKSRDELEAACAALKKSNSKLTQEVGAKLQSEGQAEDALPALAFRLLSTIAEFADADINPTPRELRTSLNVGNVEAQGSIDVLVEHKLLGLVVTGNGLAYGFTPKGRAFYLSHRS
ncbi:hypothetical protein ACXX81_14080 [Pseudomonas sp. GNP013]